MTGEELEALRVRIGAPSQEAMAELLQCDPVGSQLYIRRLWQHALKSS